METLATKQVIEKKKPFKAINSGLFGELFEIIFLEINYCKGNYLKYFYVILCRRTDVLFAT